MKKLLLFMSLVVLASCSRSPQEKATDAVQAYMKTVLDDPGSYQPGEFKITELVNNQAPGYIKARDSLTALMGAGKIKLDEFIKQDSIASEMHGSEIIKGWNIVHAFRAKNAFGALVSGEMSFFVDPNYHVTVEANGQ